MIFGRSRLKRTSMILTPIPILWTLSLEVRQLLRRPKLSKPRKTTSPKTLLCNNNLNKIRLKILLLMSAALIRNLVMLPKLRLTPRNLWPMLHTSISTPLLKRSRPWKSMRLWRTLQQKRTTSLTKFSKIAKRTKIWMKSWSAFKPRMKKIKKYKKWSNLNKSAKSRGRLKRKLKSKNNCSKSNRPKKTSKSRIILPQILQHLCHRKIKLLMQTSLLQAISQP